MKKAIIISVSVLAVGAAGYFIYRRAFGRPSVQNRNTDWLKGIATFTVNGKTITLDSTDMAVSIGRGYSVSFVKGAQGSMYPDQPISLVLKKDGAIVEYIVNR